MSLTKTLAGLLTGAVLFASGSAIAADAPATTDGFPARPLTMIVPYGPGGGSGQVAAAMAEAVTAHSGAAINRDHKPGGSGMVGLAALHGFPG